VIGRNRLNLIVGWSGRFLFFFVPRQFSQDTREWPENQILIPDWTYFHCPGATLLRYITFPLFNMGEKNQYEENVPNLAENNSKNQYGGQRIPGFVVMGM